MTTNSKLRPYDLVYVEHTINTDSSMYTEITWTCVGQIISNPYQGTGSLWNLPAEAVKVRYIPDDPSTMIEVPVDSIRYAGKGQYKWVHYAKVTGRFAFPIDMLRYDMCCPVSLENNFQTIPGLIYNSHHLVDKTVVVAKASMAKFGRPWTEARWNSFGWRLEPLKTLKIEGK